MGVILVTTVQAYNDRQNTCFNKPFFSQQCTEDEALRVIYQFNDSGVLQSISNEANGLTTSFEYDQQKRLTHISTVDESSKTRQWRYTYPDNQHFMPQTVQAPYNTTDTVMRYEYDKQSYLLNKITNELGHTATIDKRNHHGQVLQSTDENGVITSQTYDNKSKLPLSITINQATTTYGYNDHQQLDSITTPEKVTLRYRYPLDSLKKGSELKKEVKEVIDGDNNIFNAVSNTITNNAGEVVYQALNKTLKHDVHPSHQLKLVQDNAGNIQQVISGHLTTDYTYNAYGEKTEIKDTVRGITKLKYNEAGQLIRKEDGKHQRFDYHYDVLNRLTTVDINQQPLLAYVYDVGDYAKGRLTSLTRWDANHSSTLANNYDAVGNVLTQTSTINDEKSRSYKTQYTYNKDNQMTSILYPSGFKVVYDYNHLGEVSKISQVSDDGLQTILADNIQHLPFGAVSSLTFENGLALKREFNLQYQLTNQSVHGITQTQYQYDNYGHITQANDTNYPTQNKTYTYDDFNRLKTLESPTIKRSFDYDNWGLLVEENAVKGLKNDKHDKKDANGNIVEIDGLTVHYDALNQIERIEKDGRLIADYQYNGYGQRISKTVDGKQTVFIYNTDNQLIEIITDNQTIDIVYLDGKPLAQINNGQVYYFINDVIGTPNILFDGKGQVQWQADVHGYEIQETLHNITQNLRFAGQYYDEESGFYYNNARYYHPKLGGYLQPDSLDVINGGDTDPYAYAGNNPVNNSDPLGLCYKCISPEESCKKHTDFDSWFSCYKSHICMGVWYCVMSDGDFKKIHNTFYHQHPTQALELQTGLDLADYMKRLATHFANGFMDDTTFGLTGFGYENGLFNASAYYAGTGASLAVGLLYGGTYIKGGMLLAKATLPKIVGESVKASHEAGKIREFITTEKETYYRVFSGNMEDVSGRFIVKTKPKSSMYAQEALALPKHNKAEVIQELKIPEGTHLRRSRAAPQKEDGFFPDRRGGAEQFEIKSKVPKKVFTDAKFEEFK
ncbi:RHS repeat domain-containing protein [Cysteiniphilum sp. 6C5]